MRLGILSEPRAIERGSLTGGSGNNQKAAAR